MQSIYDRSSRVVSLEASIVCAINNDRSSRVVSLEASRHCLIYYSLEAHTGSCFSVKV